MPSLNLRRHSSNSSDPSNHSKKLQQSRSLNHGSTSGGSDGTATVSHDPSEEEAFSQGSYDEAEREEQDGSDNLRVPGMIEEIDTQSVHSSQSQDYNMEEHSSSQGQGPVDEDGDPRSNDAVYPASSSCPIQAESSATVPQTPEESTSIPFSASEEEEKADDEGNTPLPASDSTDSAPTRNQPQQAMIKSPNNPTFGRAASGGSYTNSSWDMQSDQSSGDRGAAARTAASAAKKTNPNFKFNSRALHRKLSLSGRPAIQFTHVRVREYDVCIGDNPCCGYGPPISLDWTYYDPGHDIPLDVYEQHYQLPRQAMYGRSRRTLVLSYTERRARLWRAGYSLEEIDEVTEKLEREKWRKSLLGNLEPLYKLQELWVLHAKPFLFRKSRKLRELDQQLEYVEQLVRQEHSHHSISLEYASHDMVPEDSRQEGDLEADTKYSTKESKEVMDSFNSQLEERKAQQSFNDDNDYGIRVDKKQHDKATEILLCSLRRPHMRAFHASWFSFFVAFFTWFAITPLLSEVKETLGLSKADIWMSSLFGTAGTILFRILTGPACDVWGARIVMSVILIVAAIPTAFTGFVSTSAGLSLVRLFIGIGGSSFVACQYWTSAMFSRATAGTANALVAGWGNLGGGVTNLMMGSVFFPLFRWFYRDFEDTEDTDSSELAWRTVFVVPAALSIMTAFIILCYCDDSPTGSYRDRIRREKLLVADPMQSLKHAARNWNVWILAIQYSCCFGVEVTMTNATALYFKDEFGQSTVSAAGIASIFGFMNLWARGVGGFFSDKLQDRYHMKGRLFWQVTTLTLEGVGVGLFGMADTLGGSIAALVFLSCMVQSAEGSTFGIVPYVSRRYTGSVVGIVGSGGNAGAAMFSVFFVYFSYSTAFILMGLSAIISAFLSVFIRTEKLEKTYEDVALEFEQWQKREGNQANKDKDETTPDAIHEGAEATPCSPKDVTNDGAKSQNIEERQGVPQQSETGEPNNVEKESNSEVKQQHSSNTDFQA